MSPEEIAHEWPEAVTFARAIRQVFGDGVRLLHARNAAGRELGKDPAIGYGQSPDKEAMEAMEEFHSHRARARSTERPSPPRRAAASR